MEKAIRRFLVSFSILCLVSVASFAFQAAPASKGGSATQEQVTLGHQQFAESCAFCHGANATGGSEGPNLLLSAIVRHDLKGESIGRVIREGRPGKGMPPIGLNEQQIEDVVMYLHARIAETDLRGPRRPGGEYQTKELLTGNSGNGEIFFDGPGGCIRCHSSTGDLKGIASRYSAVELQARFLYPAGTLSTITVINRSGERFTGTLLDRDDFGLAITMTDGWYRSWPANSVKVVQLQDPLAKHRELLYKFTSRDMHDVLAYLETLK